MYHALPLLTALLCTPAADPKPEVPPAPVQEVLDAYLKAVAAKDAAALTALADVPWLDRDRQLIRDRAGLRPAVERALAQAPAVKGKQKVQTFRYQSLRGGVKEEAQRKLLDEVLGEDGWLVMLEDDGNMWSDRVLLIRVKGGKGAVVAGPLKSNQFQPENRIPESVERLLDKAERFELYSVSPERDDGKDAFHGWKVLGKTEVKGAADRKRLADVLRLGAEDNAGKAANCFNPRHGIRLTAGEQTVDLVICLQCLSVEVYTNGKQVKGFLTSDEPGDTLNSVLKAASVQLAKPAKE